MLTWYNFMQVQLVIPDCSLDSALQCFQGVTPTQDHYCLTEIPLYAFTEVEFIKTFIKKGTCNKVAKKGINDISLVH